MSSDNHEQTANTLSNEENLTTNEMNGGESFESVDSITNQTCEDHDLVISLPDNFRADIAKPREQWCPTCSWDGSWANLLNRWKSEGDRLKHNSSARMDHLDSGPDPDKELKHVSFTRDQLQPSATAGNICCAVLFSLLQKNQGGRRKYIVLENNQDSTLLSRKLGGARILDALPVNRHSQRNQDWVGTLHWEHLDFATRWRHWDFFAFVAESLIPPGIPLRSTSQGLPSVNLGSDDTFMWAKERLRGCLDGHDLCRLPQSGFVPSRLVYIRPRKEVDGVALRERCEIPAGTQYAALSQ
jgi:hypothetical protein